MTKRFYWFGMIAERLVHSSKDYVWSDGSMIFCRTKEIADAIANMLETLYETQGDRVPVTTGFYDPEEDEKNNEVDECTGWWYVDII